MERAEQREEERGREEGKKTQRLRAAKGPFSSIQLTVIQHMHVRKLLKSRERII